MKRIDIFVVLVSLLSMISCEKEADPIDFVDPDVIAESLGINEPSDEMSNIPSDENPILVGIANNVSFNAISAELTQETIGVDQVLIIKLVDTEENQITITITNPESRTYAIGTPGTPSFDVEYIDALSGDAFITMQTANSNSSSGVFNLEYSLTGENSALISAQFVFTAFVETLPGVPPSRFVEFEQGNLVELPVVIIN